MYATGQVYADIEILNNFDLERAQNGMLPPNEVRRVMIRALVDTGAYTLAINENILHALGLRIVETRPMRLANDGVQSFGVSAPVEIRFENRTANCRAIVLPGDAEPLLGAIPLEEMDVLVDPLRNQLVVNPAHPDRPVMLLKSVRQK